MKSRAFSLIVAVTRTGTSGNKAPWLGERSSQKLASVAVQLTGWSPTLVRV